MEHPYASEHRLVEQYLLDELSPEMRDEFEQHFFDCRECAAELRMTSEFLQAARTELQRAEAETVMQATGSRYSLRTLLQWRPVFAVAAFAACLLMVVYQNAVTLPRLRSEVAHADIPAVLPSLSLVGGNSRGGSLPSVNASGAGWILLQVDIPMQEGITSYTCSLYSPRHELLWSVPVSAEAAKDTVSLRAPLGDAAGGTYSLVVRAGGSQGSAAATGTELVSYFFVVNTGTANSGQ
jgi:hypothetical protein